MEDEKVSHPGIGIIQVTCFLNRYKATENRHTSLYYRPNAEF